MWQGNLISVSQTVLKENLSSKLDYKQIEAYQINTVQVTLTEPKGKIKAVFPSSLHR